MATLVTSIFGTSNMENFVVLVLNQIDKISTNDGVTRKTKEAKQEPIPRRNPIRVWRINLIKQTKSIIQL